MPIRVLATLKSARSIARVHGLSGSLARSTVAVEAPKHGHSRLMSHQVSAASLAHRIKRGRVKTCLRTAPSHVKASGRSTASAA